MTFAALAEAYLDQHLRNRPTQNEYRSLYRRHFHSPQWGGSELASITRFQVMELNQTFLDSPNYGNKVVGFLSRVYRWGQNTINPQTHRPYWEGENPARGIVRHACCARERVMDYAELTALLLSIDGLSPKYQAFFLARLLVPCRITELCQMRRSAVSLTGKWIKHTTKNGRPHTIYIPRQAMEALATLPVHGEYYFTGHYDRPLTPGAARRIWTRWRTGLQLHDLWLLDFRRTLASYLYRIQKVDDLTAKAVLNHYDGRPVAIYVRLDYDYLAGMLQSYADWVWTFRRPVPAVADLSA
jgi:integrase